MHRYVTYYPQKEEIFNVVSHLVGVILGIAATALLVVKASLEGNVWHIVSFSIYGASMILLYLASTLYHSAKTRRVRYRLNIFDHAAIYVLIAGTYTPFTLGVLRGPMGWTLFGLTWGLALAGVVLKIFFIGRFEKLSTWSYVLLGWIAVIAIKPLIDALSYEALVYLLMGGVCYTIGAIFYSISSFKYNHAIFHIWVLAGSISHFICIYFYLI